MPILVKGDDIKSEQRSMLITSGYGRTAIKQGIDVSWSQVLNNLRHHIFWSGHQEH